jgi:aspartate/methionine/tyrosine aminotransferase
MQLGLLDSMPDATFYLWCKVPKTYGGDDKRFILELAEQGIITSPSSWLSEGMTGYFRLAMVPDTKDTVQAMDILSRFVTKTS